MWVRLCSFAPIANDNFETSSAHRRTTTTATATAPQTQTIITLIITINITIINNNSSTVLVYSTTDGERSRDCHHYRSCRGIRCWWPPCHLGSGSLGSVVASMCGSTLVQVLPSGCFVGDGAWSIGDYFGCHGLLPQESFGWNDGCQVFVASCIIGNGSGCWIVLGRYWIDGIQGSTGMG